MALDRTATVAVVGASLAGLRAAEALRAEGHTGPVVMVGAESHPPYDRPPLSKQFLAGTWDRDRIALRAPDKLAALDLDLRLGRVAVSLDVEGRVVELDDGTSVAFDGAVIATGAQPRRLPDTAGVAGVHTLRTVEDSLALAAAAGAGVRMVVVGAGFIGSEVAATCAGLGAEVSVVEALPVPLARVLGPVVGRACAALHADHGVALHTGVGVAGLEVTGEGASPATAGRVTGVRLEDGRTLDADVVVVGIGVVPTTAWLQGSGLEVADGVVAGPTLHCAPHVVAAGDVARWFDRSVDALIRIEHWTNAAEQGAMAARNLLAGPEASQDYVPVPYVWSDQYDVKIQIIGHPGPDDDVVVVDGAIEEGRFVALYGRAGRLTAALGFSRPRQLMGYRPLLEQGASFDEALARRP
ncbi:MAG TPA: FAD-dependent oxidoreductase [Acidimicrobiales bacterium]|nr:FAD-dependent oxidoreductase [Acidimicrobiales bacterium]